MEITRSCRERRSNPIITCDDKHKPSELSRQSFFRNHVYHVTGLRQAVLQFEPVALDSNILMLTETPMEQWNTSFPQAKFGHEVFPSSVGHFFCRILAQGSWHGVRTFAKTEAGMSVFACARLFHGRASTVMASGTRQMLLGNTFRRPAC